MSSDLSLLSRLICFKRHLSLSLSCCSDIASPWSLTSHSHWLQRSRQGSCYRMWCNSEGRISIQLAYTKAGFLCKDFELKIICQYRILACFSIHNSSITKSRGEADKDVFEECLFVLCWGWRAAAKRLRNYLKFRSDCYQTAGMKVKVTPDVVIAHLGIPWKFRALIRIHPRHQSRGG